ncbi:MAG: UDP-N-acetylglucosamine 4,6-dehydratase (inverting) [Candidatus Omnitrophota bacterium]
MLKDKTILITGGTGSFGKKLTEVLLTQYKLKRVIIFSRDEFKQFEMAQVFPVEKYPAIRYFLGDVRDKERLHRAFRHVDYVVHAAALKQVPAAEYNPFEAVKTNIHGAQNVIDCALDQNVKRVLALSTDKAANPINLYGATKLCSDKLFIAGNSYAGADQNLFSVVRYGNVVGSRGSVIPFFMEQRAKGVLPITDPRMTRFWITLEESVRFVLQCLTQMAGGELFIPKIPSMNIMDLAKTIALECRTKVVGIRPGEKLHEVLLPSNEARHALEFKNHFAIEPEFEFWGHRSKNLTGGKKVFEDFEYNSLNNPHFLSVPDMRKLLISLGYPLGIVPSSKKNVRRKE